MTKVGERCTQCAKEIVPYINRAGLLVRYFTDDLHEICRRCAEPRSEVHR